MSTPEAPPQTPPTPVASDAAADVREPTAPPEVTANGESGGAAEAPPDASLAEDAPTEHAGEGAAPAAPMGERKRRRRRRRKKPGAQAAGEGAASDGTSPAQPEDGEQLEGPDQVGDITSSETADVEGEALGDGASPALPARRQYLPDASAPQASTGRGQGPREKKKERKPGPPRERPPVTAGDIVFGKIVEISDEAILIDIPGKARAIFDRGEMLLPEDDEPARPARPGAEPQPAGDEQPVVEAPPGDLPAVLSDESALPTAEASPADDAASAPDAGAAPQAQQDLAGASPAPPGGQPEELTPEAPAPPEPPKEPKVPRVILEVGADFIAVVHNDGARGGLVVLTHHPNRAERTKPLVEKAFQEKTTTLGLVTGVIKGGIEVDIDGLRAFAPGSHVDLRLGADLSHLVAKRLPFFVTQYAKRGRDVVLSRKSIIEEDARKTRADALAKLKVGEELDGVVRSVVPFGAFVDVGGIEGLVPLQEMSHNRADGPSDVFKAGEPTRVKVIKIDDRGKIWLSRKATIPDPWQRVAEKYALGTRHAGKVVRLQPFGAFIELESGIDGLIHTQDLSIKRIESPADVVKVGDSIEVVVSNVDASQHKIALHPALQGDLANEPPQRVVAHKPVKARVVAIESGGLVVRVLGVTGRNARGYITSAGTGTPRGTELRKAFNVGQEVEAKVVEVDPRRGEVKLSIKALSEEQERSAYQQYRQQLKAEARFTLADLIMKKKS